MSWVPYRISNTAFPADNAVIAYDLAAKSITEDVETVEVLTDGSGFTSGAATFTFSTAPLDDRKISVHLNGIKLKENLDFTRATTTGTLHADWGNLEADDIIDLEYYV